MRSFSNVLLEDKIVTVVGFARSGQAAASLVLREGGRVKISEQKDDQTIHAAFREWPERHRVAVEFGGHREQFIRGSYMVVVSPGVPRNAPVIAWARSEGIPVIGELELAWQFCPGKVIGVTGSNGKTTVSTLIARILEAAGQEVCLCGNIGRPLSAFVEKMNKDTWAVVEISSFQLETIQSFRPRVALWLNFSPNHMDRHADMDEYFAAKKTIFLNQTAEDFAVLNFGEERLRALKGELKARVAFFADPQQKEDVGTDNPNFLAAVRVAEILGIRKDSALQTCLDFKGVEHRLERVRRLDGVEYVNDSKATTVESGRWALQSLERPIVMISGGRDKNSDFTELKEMVAARVKHLVLIGEARRKMAKAWKGAVPIEESATLPEAVNRARALADTGDCILLCPMCASFDMFKDYEDRGRVFKDLVNRLT